MQGRVDDYYRMFIETVARNRATTPNRVHTGYGQGRILTAAEALNSRVVDRVATLDETLSRLGVTTPARTAARGTGMSLETRMRRLSIASGYRI
jgi:ClpP class serine protease